MFSQEMLKMCENNILIKNFEIIKNNALRIQTVFKYQNGENIDLFLEKIENENNCLYKLSDYGNSLLFLEESGTKEDKLILNFVSEMHSFSEVKIQNNEFYIIKEKEFPGIWEFLSLAEICFKVSSIKSFYS